MKKRAQFLETQTEIGGKEFSRKGACGPTPPFSLEAKGNSKPRVVGQSLSQASRNHLSPCHPFSLLAPAPKAFMFSPRAFPMIQTFPVLTILFHAYLSQVG